MRTRFRHQIRLFRILLTIPLIAGGVAPSSAAVPYRERTPARCQECMECARELARPRVVGLRIYNQPDISDAGIGRILEAANQIWKPYHVSVEPSTSRSAITVVISRDTSPGATDFRPSVLGDTLFTAGHATPYIHLWPGNAEALAAGSEINGRPYTSLSRDERKAILVQMLGVALAHELAHYLLDTASHSASGLLRGTIGVSDLAFPKPSHLRLTDEQQQMICLASSAAQ